MSGHTSATTTGNTKECPFCAETIKAKALKCRFCGSDLPEAAPATAPAALAPSVPGKTNAPAPASPAPCVASSQVLDLLTHLVDKNLAVYEEDEHGHGRYRLLETVRQYAREKLMESGAGAVRRDRHRDFFLWLAEETAPNLVGPEQTRWLNCLEAEHDDLRAALEWCLAGPQEGETALRLVNALSEFWFRRGYFAEGRQHIERALAADPDAPALRRAGALEGAGALAFFQDDMKAVRAFAGQALGLRRTAGDTSSAAWPLFVLSTAAVQEGDLEQAQTLSQESLALAQAAGNKRVMSSALGTLGLIAWQRGDLDSSAARHAESLALAREVGDLWQVADALFGLAQVRGRQGAFEEARRLHREALLLSREIGDRIGVTWNLEGLGWVAAGAGRAQWAARMIGAATGLFDALRFPPPLLYRAERERVIAGVIAALGEAAFHDLVAEGQAMTLEQAIAYALEHEPPEETA